MMNERKKESQRSASPSIREHRGAGMRRYGAEGGDYLGAGMQECRLRGAGIQGCKSMREEGWRYRGA